MLCDDCSQIIIDPRQVTYELGPKNGRYLTGTGLPRFDQHPEFPLLKASGETGCQLCISIRDEIMRYIKSNLIQGTLPKGLRALGTCEADFTIEPPFVLFGSKGITTLGFFFYETGYSGDIRGTVYYDIQSDENSPARTHGKIGPRPLGRETLCSQNVVLIQGWVEKCIQEHKYCNSNSEANLPTRLIDVGSANGTDIPKLVVPGVSKGRYIALSHCWGVPTVETPHFKTVLANLKERLEGIPIESMPLNFRDAVIVARNLGIRFVWIDSLCIIQDDATDWKTEAAKMGSIYASAYLTIAATSAQSTNDGFLRRESSSQAVTMPYRSCEDGLLHGEFYLQPEGYEKTTESIRSSIWAERGWTFQERLLSARVLHFCKHRLCFECRGCNISENNLDDEPPAFWLRPDPSMNTPNQYRSDSLVSHQTYNFWYVMVEEYTKLKFTFEDDRVPAILGLISEMALIVEDECFWGTWIKEFRRGLLWKEAALSAHTKRLTRPPMMRAPSWSWMSVNGPISYQFHNPWTQSKLEILNTITNTESPRPWALQLRGTLIRLSGILSVDEEERRVDVFYNGLELGFGWTDCDENCLLDRKFWYLVVEEEEKPNWTTSHGLLIENSGDRVDTFHRVGSVMVDSEINLLDFPSRTLFLV